MFEEKSRKTIQKQAHIFTLQYSLALTLKIRFSGFQFLGFSRYVLASCYAMSFAFLLKNGFMARARKQLTASSKLRKEIPVWNST